ncbi:hypothetical protein [Streptacidiphilus fuscans]|uniref:Secreted protein n=1 Tax=Streptacidiphilus fuscans TaxID=2789292 RepID=A0A931B7B9_9ACTN|nr:hypothetical protein [Streptacidiphilus fuscans]MBF9072449.1 hypothetical protein [Streptacidiphilus fuscans]
MRRELVQAGAWAVATGAAVSVSWLGVHSVLADDGYQQPSALPLSVTGAGSRTPAPLPTALGTAGHSPTPTPSAKRSSSPSAAPSGRPHSSPSSSPEPTTTASGEVKSFTPNGGRIVVAMGATSASLVSATPDSGWSMHVYTGDQWLRVDFVGSTVDSIFYVTWNGTAPMVQTWQAPAPS